MSTDIKKLSFLFLPILLAGLFFANFAAAQNACPSNAVCIQNPLTWKDFPSLISAIVKFLQEVALVITAIVLVLAGYYFVTSMGDPAKVSQARKMVLYALIGLAIILMAQGIIALIQTVFKSSATSGTPSGSYTPVYYCSADGSTYTTLDLCSQNCPGGYLLV